MGEFEAAAEKFRELAEIMARLRAPGGCPWDRKQTFDTIKTYLLEETYEVMEAIDARDWPHLVEELGDLLLQPVFFAEMAREEGLFSIADALDAINQKLVRRHPHVFGEVEATTAEEVKHNWDEIKRAERGDRKTESILDDVPRGLPALMEAEKIGQKTAKAGFEWPDVDGVVAKIREEIEELAEARQNGNAEHIEHEMGDLFFSVVNLARHLKIDPEQALRKMNGRFRARFGHIEREVAKSGRKMEETSLAEMDALWLQAKKYQ